MALAPPPGSASLRLNSLQQRSALLANRELTPASSKTLHQ